MPELITTTIPTKAMTGEVREPHSFDFKIGDRTYFVARDDRRPGYRIVANGDMVEYVSARHYGDVGAFLRIAERLQAIEDLWLKLNPR